MSIIKYWHPAEDEGIFPAGTRGLDDNISSPPLLGAVTIALATAATLISGHVQAAELNTNWDDQVPSGSLVNLKIDELYWQNTVAPLQAKMYVALPITDDSNVAVTAVSSIVDDNTWVAPPPKVATQTLRLPYPADDEAIIANVQPPIVFPSPLVLSVSTSQLFLSSTAVTWSATGGTITPGTGNNATYAAGATPGSFSVTATLTSGVATVTTVTIVATPTNATVRLDSPFQVMDGFGAAQGDDEPALITDHLADLLWDKSKGIGLNIFRCGVNPDGTGIRHDATDFAASPWDLWGHVHKALLREPNLKVIAQPWSPPNALKTNGSQTGGALLTSAYDVWAGVIRDFYTLAAAQTPPVPVYALGPQNEPDFTASGTTCGYTNAQMEEFTKHLVNAFNQISPRPLMLLPEAEDWSNLDGYLSAIEGDPAALAGTDIYTVHQYSHATALAPTRYARQHLWQTEMAGLAGGPEATFDATITDGIAIALWIHNAIVTGNVNAWIWWWGIEEFHSGALPYTSTDNESLILTNGDTSSPTITNYSLTKRLYTIGNFSKFVRPGYQRFNIVGTLPTNVSATAYKDPVTGNITIVAINNNGTSTSLTLSITGGSVPQQFGTWVTSGTAIDEPFTPGNLEPQASVPVSGGTFTVTLAANSVTTFATNPVDEELQWNSLWGVKPQQASMFQKLPYLPDPEEIVVTAAATVIDDTPWATPAPVIQVIKYPQPWDVEEISAATLFGQSDEDFWVNKVPPVSLVMGRLYLPEVEELPAATLFGQDDEDLWISGVAPLSLTMGRVYLPDVEELPATTLFGQYDEDFWKNQVSPVIYNLFKVLPFTDPEEISAGSLFGQSDEDFDGRLLFPAPVGLTLCKLYLPDSEEISAGFLSGQDDEDYWNSGVTPVVASIYQHLPLGDVEEIPAGNLTGQPDEDYWQNYAPITQASLYQKLPYNPEPEQFYITFVPPGQPDEDFWQNYVAPIQATMFVRLPIIDPEEELIVQAVAPGQPEEDLWQNYVLPIQSSLFQRLPLGDPEELPANTLSGQPDEDLWKNQVIPTVASIFQKLPLGDVEEIPAGSLFGQDDEDLWINAVAPVQYSMYQRLPFIDVEEVPAGSLLGTVEEDFWNNSVRPIVNSHFIKLPLQDNDEITTAVVVTLPFDEDFWFNPAAPIQAAMVRKIPSGELEELSIPLFGQEDEDLWINPVFPIQASHYIRLPLGDPEELVVIVPIPLDEDFWVSQQLPLQASVSVHLPLGDAEEIPANKLFGQYDEDFDERYLGTVGQVGSPLPEQFLMSLSFPYNPDPEKLPAGDLYNLIDEDYWQNGVAPITYKMYQVLPYVADADTNPKIIPLPFDEEFDWWRLFGAAPSYPQTLQSYKFDKGDAEPAPIPAPTFIRKLNIVKLIARSFSLDYMNVYWELYDGLMTGDLRPPDILDFDFYVLRAESAMGPYTQVIGPLRDTYFFCDDRVSLRHKWREYFYKLRVVHRPSGHEQEFGPTGTNSPEPDLIATEILRLEDKLMREFTGRKCYLFPVMTIGTNCTCFDTILKKRTRSNHLPCFDTGWLGGYLSPVECFIQIDPSPKNAQQTSLMELQQNDTTARMIAFPPVKPGDIIVEALNRRWKVMSVNSTQRLRANVHQELTLHELPKTNIEYDLPVNVDLNTLVESGSRNFTNATNIEEDGEYEDIFAIFGGPKGTIK